MLRAINTNTTHRRPATQAHRARPAKATQDTKANNNAKEDNAMKNENIEREAYIGFIVKMLNERADLRAIKIVYEFVLRLID